MRLRTQLFQHPHYHVFADSPCIEIGSNPAVPADTYDLDNDANTTEPTPYDLDGNPRLIDADCNDTFIVDMGAYEFDYLTDFYPDCLINFDDYALFAAAWLTQPPDPNYDPDFDIGIPPDNLIDLLDAAAFCEYWLTGRKI